MRFLLVFLLAISIGHAHDQRTPPLRTIIPKLEALIHKTLQQKKIPGMAVAVVSHGKIIFMKGFGVRTIGEKAPVDTLTVFQLGSVSKAITSTLVAILNRDQIVTLTHPVETLPETTVHHILSHTTGVPSPGFNALIERGGSPSEARKKLQETDRQHQPGENFAYHNVAYSLIASIIEHQTGNLFEDVLQEKLLQPLHMEHTSSTWDSFINQKNRVSVHAFRKLKGKRGKVNHEGVFKVPYRKDYTNFTAAGGFSSNIHDMALFLAAVMGARPDVISPADLEGFMEPLIHTPDQWHRTRHHRDRITETSYALGWRHLVFGGNRVVFHGGGIRGIAAIVAFLPTQKTGIVILQNTASLAAFLLSMQFLDWVLGMPPKQWIK